jgi:hypothetical protein
MRGEFLTFWHFERFLRWQLIRFGFLPVLVEEQIGAQLDLPSESEQGIIHMSVTRVVSDCREEAYLLAPSQQCMNGLYTQHEFN